ncbi:MAG: cytochrome-c peroxidase, partial [Bryobacteraceae bacterium]
MKLAVALLVVIYLPGWGQDLGSLKRVDVPQPSGLDKYVADRAMLVALGKALFWDMQAGSDGRLACASCHFHAGADHRSRNQLAHSTISFPVNHLLIPEDFPFHVLSNSNNNRSAVLRDSAVVAGSAGVFRRIFKDVVALSATDDGFDSGDTPAFSLNGINVRRVTTRNTPTVINSVYYVRNFWDGRARSVFTGFTPFGESDVRENALVVAEGRARLERVRVENSSLASQAVGPPLNGIEMSYDGRTWPKLGKKMLGLRPLALQRVAPDDSVRGPLANPDGPGLAANFTYRGMVQAAFKPEYFASASLFDVQGREVAGVAPPQSTNEFTQAEFNFALFWGLALQAYQSTLISDDSPFDQFSDGDSSALSAEQQQGLRIFRTQAGCTNCHVGPEFTAASFTSVARRGETQGAGNGRRRDTGFFRIGVRPIDDDAGIGADDDLGQPLSVVLGDRSGVAGAFKTPTLRNVE